MKRSRPTLRRTSSLLCGTSRAPSTIRKGAVVGQISPDDWQPVGVSTLEEAAWKVLRSTNNTCVLAGPGSGKTELLAQRASYLLQTGICRQPQRILAISFKRDAAKNLRDRVVMRCGPDLSRRFVSLTFDAFTKSLIDQFRLGIPLQWRPTYPYQIAFPRMATTRTIIDIARETAPAHWKTAVSSIKANTFETHILGPTRLPLGPREPASADDYAVFEWWPLNLQNVDGSSLNFVMINRLAKLVQRANVQLGLALKATYTFVFVDEFQDTTFAQYDFLRSVFNKSGVSVTSVGDIKQRIMIFAGAQATATSKFEEEFGAEIVPLQRNFRSSPALVAI